MYLQKQTPVALKSEALEPLQTGEFAAIHQHVTQLYNHWNLFYDEFSRLNSPYTQEFQQYNQDFSRAVEQILTALGTPTLTLATTGTTSSGKSTLVNLLCGADIMPRMAGEMSAGIVTIKHNSDGRRLLKIEKTPSATWQCGEWKDLGDDAIRDRLTQTMDAFNKAKQERDLASPIIELNYPIACFLPNAGLLDLSDLPVHTQFQIMDLPGKRNQDDKINSTVIQNCRRALSIVTYDMAQTDEKLRQKLIGEVLDQVKLMGGSPARMLFALNRIDVFRKDHDSERREQEAAEQTIKEIKQILHERLPEHRSVLDDLSYSKLSSLPALLAWQMHNSQDDLRINAADNLDKNFGNLIEESIREELPRSAKRWEAIEFNKVGESIWKNSYAEHFFPVLESHIRKHFAKLIAAPLLTEFEGTVSHIIGQVDRTCMIEVASTHQHLSDIKEQLKQDEDQIKNILEQYANDLMKLPDLIEQNPKIFAKLETNLEDLGDLYNDEDIKEFVLQALPKVIIDPIQWVSGIPEGLAQSLKQSTINFSDTTADELSSSHTNRLAWICGALTREVYTPDLYEEFYRVYSVIDGVKHDNPVYGYKLKAVDDAEKVKLNRILAALDAHLDSLSLLMQEVYNEKLSYEEDRIKDLIEKILKVFINRLNQTIESQGFMLTLRFDESIHKKIELKVKGNKLNNKYSRTTKGTEANPWLLWLGERNVNYGIIPSVDKLHEMINEHLERLKNLAAESLNEAIKEYYDEVATKMNDYIDSIMDDVNAKLAAKQYASEAEQQAEELKWQTLRSSMVTLNEQMQQLHNYKV